MGKFKCAMCGGTFRKGWTDNEADDEYRQNFTEYSKDERETVCDDCYARILKQGD